MAVAALVAWVVTALGGFVMLARWISNGGLRQQHAGLFEELAQSGHVEADGVGWGQVAELRGSGVYSVAPRTIDAGAIARVHPAARKHVCAAHEGGALMAADHEGLRTSWAVSKNHDGGGWTGVGGNRLWHSAQ